MAEDREQKPCETKFEVPAMVPSPPPLSHSVVVVDDNQISYSRGENSRRVFTDLNDAKRTLVDHDEDKYKRRPAAELLKRWWTNMSALQRNRGGGGLYKRYCMTAILIIGIFTVLAVVFSRLGHFSTDNDPLFDPRNNPNIRVADSAM